MGQQPLSVLKDDVEVSTEPTRASVVSDAAHQLHHLPLGRGSSALVELERIDDVEVHAVESGVEDAVQIGVWAAEDEALPSRIPVANLVVSRPFGIFDVEPGRRAAGPILSPVESGSLRPRRCSCTPARSGGSHRGSASSRPARLARTPTRRFRRPSSRRPPDRSRTRRWPGGRSDRAGTPRCPPAGVVPLVPLPPGVAHLGTSGPERGARSN